MWVMDAVFVRLLIQEVEHIFNSQGQSTASMGGAEDGLKQVVHKLLQRSLWGETEKLNLQSFHIHSQLV